MSRDLREHFSTPMGEASEQKGAQGRAGRDTNDYRSSNNGTAESLRERFIEQTETYLTRHLKHEQRPWPHVCSPVLKKVHPADARATVSSCRREG
jgi:hypothetical protein